MNNRKPVLYILLIVLGFIVIYNYMIAPYLIQYHNGMGMGMHGYMYSVNNYYVNPQFTILIIIIIMLLLLFELLKPQAKSNECSKCGKKIGSDRWKVCPICGSPVNIKRG